MYFANTDVLDIDCKRAAAGGSSAFEASPFNRLDFSSDSDGGIDDRIAARDHLGTNISARTTNSSSNQRSCRSRQLRRLRAALGEESAYVRAAVSPALTAAEGEMIADVGVQFLNFDASSERGGGADQTRAHGFSAESASSAAAAASHLPYHHHPSAQAVSAASSGNGNGDSGGGGGGGLFFGDVFVEEHRQLRDAFANAVKGGGGAGGGQGGGPLMMAMEAPSAVIRADEALVASRRARTIATVTAASRVLRIVLETTTQPILSLTRRALLAMADIVRQGNNNNSSGSRSATHHSRASSRDIHNSVVVAAAVNAHAMASATTLCAAFHYHLQRRARFGFKPPQRVVSIVSGEEDEKSRRRRTWHFLPTDSTVHRMRSLRECFDSPQAVLRHMLGDDDADMFNTTTAANTSSPLLSDETIRVEAIYPQHSRERRKTKQRGGGEEKEDGEDEEAKLMALWEDDDFDPHCPYDNQFDVSSSSSSSSPLFSREGFNFWFEADLAAIKASRERYRLRCKERGLLEDILFDEDEDLLNGDEDEEVEGDNKAAAMNARSSGSSGGGLLDVPLLANSESITRRNSTKATTAQRFRSQRSTTKRSMLERNFPSMFERDPAISKAVFILRTRRRNNDGKSDQFSLPIETLGNRHSARRMNTKHNSSALSAALFLQPILRSGGGGARDSDESDSFEWSTDGDEDFYAIGKEDYKVVEPLTLEERDEDDDDGPSLRPTIRVALQDGPHAFVRRGPLPRATNNHVGGYEQHNNTFASLTTTTATPPSPPPFTREAYVPAEGTVFARREDLLRGHVTIDATDPLPIRWGGADVSVHVDGGVFEGEKSRDRRRRQYTSDASSSSYVGLMNPEQARRRAAAVAVSQGKHHSPEGAPPLPTSRFALLRGVLSQPPIIQQQADVSFQDIEMFSPSSRSVPLLGDGGRTQQRDVSRPIVMGDDDNDDDDDLRLLLPQRVAEDQKKKPFRHQTAVVPIAEPADNHNDVHHEKLQHRDRRKPVVTFDKAFRKLFFNLVTDIFLNSGSYGATPKCILRAQQMWEKIEHQDPQRWRGSSLLLSSHPSSSSSSSPDAPLVGSPLLFNMKRVKNQLALLLDTHPRDMALLVNCNAALTTVLKSLPWEATDSIILLSCDYDATFLQAQYLEETYGVDVIIVPISPPMGDEAVCRKLNAALEEVYLLVNSSPAVSAEEATRQNANASGGGGVGGKNSNTSSGSRANNPDLAAALLSLVAEEAKYSIDSFPQDNNHPTAGGGKRGANNNNGGRSLSPLATHAAAAAASPHLSLFERTQLGEEIVVGEGEVPEWSSSFDANKKRVKRKRGQAQTDQYRQHEEVEVFEAMPQNAYNDVSSTDSSDTDDDEEEKGGAGDGGNEKGAGGGAGTGRKKKKPPLYRGRHFTAKRRPMRFPRLFSFSHVTSRHGWIFPARAMTAIAHSYGCLVCVDGAQAVGHFRVSIPHIGCDFYMGTGHKWLYTMPGTAFLAVSPAVQDLISPLATQQEQGEFGFGVNTSSDPSLLFQNNFNANRCRGCGGTSYNPPSYSTSASSSSSSFEERFALSLPQHDVTPFLAMEQSLGFLNEVCGGVGTVMDRGAALAQEAVRRLSDMWGLGEELMWSPHDARHPCHVYPQYGGGGGGVRGGGGGLDVGELSPYDNKRTAASLRHWSLAAAAAAAATDHRQRESQQRRSGSPASKNPSNAASRVTTTTTTSIAPPSPSTSTPPPPPPLLLLPRQYYAAAFPSIGPIVHHSHEASVGAEVAEELVACQQLAVATDYVESLGCFEPTRYLPSPSSPSAESSSLQQHLTPSQKILRHRVRTLWSNRDLVGGVNWFSVTDSDAVQCEEEDEDNTIRSTAKKKTAFVPAPALLSIRGLLEQEYRIPLRATSPFEDCDAVDSRSEEKKRRMGKASTFSRKNTKGAETAAAAGEIGRDGGIAEIEKDLDAFMDPSFIDHLFLDTIRNNEAAQQRSAARQRLRQERMRWICDPHLHLRHNFSQNRACLLLRADRVWAAQRAKQQQAEGLNQADAAMLMATVTGFDHYPNGGGRGGGGIGGGGGGFLMAQPWRWNSAHQQQEEAMAAARATSKRERALFRVPPSRLRQAGQWYAERIADIPSPSSLPRPPATPQGVSLSSPAPRIVVGRQPVVIDPTDTGHYATTSSPMPSSPGASHSASTRNGKRSITPPSVVSHQHPSSPSAETRHSMPLIRQDSAGRLTFTPRHDYDRGKPFSCLPLLPLPDSLGCTNADAVKLMGYLLTQGITTMIVVIEDPAVAAGLGGSGLVEFIRSLPDAVGTDTKDRNDDGGNIAADDSYSFTSASMASTVDGGGEFGGHNLNASFGDNTAASSSVRSHSGATDDGSDGRRPLNSHRVHRGDKGPAGGGRSGSADHRRNRRHQAHQAPTRRSNSSSRPKKANNTYLAVRISCSLVASMEDIIAFGKIIKSMRGNYGALAIVREYLPAFS